MPYTFTPPTYTLKPVNGGRLNSFFPREHGYAVIKRGSTYESIAAAVDLEKFYEPGVDYVYLGGHQYPISDAEAALLIAAGYSPTLES